MREEGHSLLSVPKQQSPLSIGQKSEFVLKFILLIALYCVLFGFIVLGVLLFVRPVTYEKTEELEVTFSSIQAIDLGRNGIISITDSTDCNGYINGACLHSVCDVSILNSKSIQFCSFSLKLSKPINFSKIVINCPKGTCKVDLNSKNFSATSMFVYGDTLSMKSSSLVVTNFYFDTIIGNLLVEIFKGSLISASTTKGDISIQVDQEAKLSTFSSTKNVCVTSEKGWKDAATSISTLDDVLVENDPKIQTCFEVYSSVDRDYEKMIENNSHPVFNQLRKSIFPKPSESRCVTITDLMLLKSATDLPASIPAFTTIQAANAEGNIFVNVLKDSSDPRHIISPQITNPVYSLINLKLSQTWVDTLNSTFQSIPDEGKLNEVVFLNLSQDFENNQDFLWIVLFTPAFLHYSPKWISIFSLYSLSSKQEYFDVGLSPGLCPFFFRYEQSNEDQSNLISSRQKVIQDILQNFFTDIGVDPSFLILRNLYRKIQIYDVSTYPDNNEMTDKLSIVSLTKLIYCVFFAVFAISIPKYIFDQISETVSSKETGEKSKVLFLLRELVASEVSMETSNQKILQEEKKPLIKVILNAKVVPISESDNINEAVEDDHEIPLKSGEFIQSKQQISGGENISAPNPGGNHNPTTTQFSGNNLHPSSILNQHTNFSNILAHLKLRNELGNSFEHLATSGAAWIQSRFLDSLELFYSMVFLQESRHNKPDSIEMKSKENQAEFNKEAEAETTMKLSELKMLYQLFCYYFNFPQEDILSNQSRALLIQYKFDIQFEKKIFKKEQNEKQDEKSQKEVQVEWLPTFAKFHPKINQQFESILQESQFSSMGLPIFLKKAEQQIYEELKDDSSLMSFIECDEWESSTYNHTENYEIKSSSELVLERQINSNYKIDTSMRTDLYELFKNSVLRPQRMPSDQFTLKYQPTQKSMMEHNTMNQLSQRISKRNFEYDVNKNFINRLLGIQTVKSFDTLVDQMRQVSLQILFMVSPLLFVAPELIGLVIYQIELNKPFEGQTPSIWNVLFSFEFPISSILAYICLLFTLIFFYQFNSKNMILLCRLVQVPFKVTLISKKETNKETNRILEENKSLSKFFSPILKILFNVLIVATVCYFFTVFSLIFVGSILIPRVQLPLVIFLGVMITVINMQVNQFKEAFVSGRINLFERFRKNLLSKFKEFKQPKEKENSEKAEQQTDKLVLSSDASYLLEERDFELFDLDDLQELFQNIDSDGNDYVSQTEIFEQFDRMNLRLSIQHLKQMFAHVKVASKPEMKYVQLGSEELNQLNKKEFSMAIDYFCGLKVTQALYILDISYEVLFLTIMKIVIQSVVIGILIYSIFKGLSTSETTFDFSTNSIASLGGIIGIAFSSREEAAKALTDDKLIDETIDKVERMFHENNPLLSELN